MIVDFTAVTHTSKNLQIGLWDAKPNSTIEEIRDLAFIHAQANCLFIAIKVYVTIDGVRVLDSIYTKKQRVQVRK